MIAQMTLRRVPDAVKKKLRARSRQSGHSINRTTIELLEEALGITASDGKKRDLSMLAGTWQEAEYQEFAGSTALFEEIDAEVWAP